MKMIFEEVVWYALGRKGNKHKQKHGYLRENKNMTNIQNFLDTLPEDDYYHKMFKDLINANRGK